MAQYSRFFGGEEGSEPEYTQPQFAEVLERIFTNGVFNDVDNELEVVENDPAAMSVIVKSGEGWINGYWYQNTEDLVKTLSAADPDDDRIDRIVLRLDTTTELEITAEVLEGTPAGEPTAPTLTQTDAIYEISLAQVLVGATVTSIADADITDERDYASVSTIIDEDDMTSDDDALTPSQQSVKAYVDDRVNTLLANLSPAGAEIPSSNGAEKVPVEGTHFPYTVLRFDPDTQENAYWRFIVPPTYQGGNVTAKIHLKSSATTGAALFEIKTVGIASGEVYDSEPATAIYEQIFTVPGTAGNLLISSSSTYDPSRTVGDEVIIEIRRNAIHASDTCTADVDVTLVEIREV